MADPNPNQAFDNYAKAAELQIEATKVIGEYAKNIAEAEFTRAKTLTQLERTKTIALANESLRRTMREIDKAERRAETDRKSFGRRAKQLELISEGVKPQSLDLLYARLEAIDWIAAKGGSATVLFEHLKPEALAPENFFTLSVHNQPAAPTEKTTNVQQLLSWMRVTLSYFVAGSPVHELLVRVIEELAAAEGKIVDEIQAHLDLMRKGNYERLHELKSLLEIKDSV